MDPLQTTDQVGGGRFRPDTPKSEWSTVMSRGVNLRFQCRLARLLIPTRHMFTIITLLMELPEAIRDFIVNI